MKLRRIQLSGFKSFKDEIELEISDGVTAVVGPNGCGKSNIVDAIKWAMGEMSPTSLRGDSLSDVIFKGTEEYRAAGLAEVTLTFENDASHWPEDGIDWGDTIPREYREMAEISITRRLHSDGDSEYKINSVDCRLRDIRNLLAGTGLGKQGYSIIEQGEVSFIVNAKPSERRLLIEEAAGITRYKDKRKRAKRKLERTRENLQRVDDVLGEVRKRVRRLERQAERAEKYRELDEELETLRIDRLMRRRRRLTEKAAEQREAIEELRTETQQAQNELESREEKLGSAKVEANRAEEAHSEATEKFYKIETRLNVAKSDREHAESSLKTARERRHEAKAERLRLDEQIEELKKARTEARSELEQMRESSEGHADELERKKERLQAAQAELEEVREERDALRERVSERRSRAQRIEDRLEHLEETEESIRQRRASLEEELEELRDSSGALDSDLEERAEELEHKEEEREETSERLESVSEELEAARERLSEVEERRRELRAELLEVEARRESLEAMREQGASYEEGVQAVLEWARREDRADVLGPLGDLVDVEEGRESAVASYLGEALDDVVVRSREAAFEAIEMLREREAGRVTLRIAEDEEEANARLDRELGKLEYVEELREATPGGRSGVRASANREGDVLFADGRLVGGSDGDRRETVLEHNRELEALAERAEDLAGRVEQLERKASEHEEKIAERSSVRDDLEASLHQIEHDVRGMRQSIDNQKRERERIEERREELETRLAPLGERLESIREERAELHDEREELSEATPELEDRLENLQGELEQHQRVVEVRQGELTETKVEIAEQNQKRSNLEERVERLGSDVESAREKGRKLGEELEELEAEIEQTREAVENAANRAEKLRERHDDQKEVVDGAKRELDEAKQQVTDLEVALVDQRKELEKRRNRLQDFEMDLNELAVGVEHLDDDLVERFDISLREAREVASDLEIEPEDRDRRIEELEREIERMGTVNPMAVEEYEETLERREFLEDQKADLEEASGDLEEAIAKMDRESRRRFEETFDAVDAMFREIFPKLFRGGRARLVLTDPDDLLETGVDIDVQPPGKQLQNVSLLSGGEKALTATSLIFSIFKLKPSPFAILDEVDAPLDEANVGRYVQMVRELNELSQMILITHNRRTMEAVDTLYGVTMEEAGVSKIVSVQLEDVDEKLAS